MSDTSPDANKAAAMLVNLLDYKRAYSADSGRTAAMGWNQSEKSRVGQEEPRQSQKAPLNNGGVQMSSGTATKQLSADEPEAAAALKLLSSYCLK